ncbi:MAG: hypothetical protein AB1411_14035 [Nitrospirota bacterium]
MWLAALAGWVMVALTPLVVEAAQGLWLDEITALMRDHQDLARAEGREAAYKPAWAQLGVVRIAFEANDLKATYDAMNGLMDILEADARGGGIPRWSAKELFDFCGKVTPGKYHNVMRHNPELSKGGFDYWDDEVWDHGPGG